MLKIRKHNLLETAYIFISLFFKHISKVGEARHHYWIENLIWVNKKLTCEEFLPIFHELMFLHFLTLAYPPFVLCRMQILPFHDIYSKFFSLIWSIFTHIDEKILCWWARTCFTCFFFAFFIRTQRTDLSKVIVFDWSCVRSS